jgi:hypothetical protein
VGYYGAKRDTLVYWLSAQKTQTDNLTFIHPIAGKGSSRKSHSPGPLGVGGYPSRTGAMRVSEHEDAEEKEGA